MKQIARHACPCLKVPNDGAACGPRLRQRAQRRKQGQTAGLGPDKGLGERSQFLSVDSKALEGAGKPKYQGLEGFQSKPGLRVLCAEMRWLCGLAALARHCGGSGHGVRAAQGCAGEAVTHQIAKPSGTRASVRMVLSLSLSRARGPA